MKKSIVATRSDVARHFRVSTRTVANWLGMACPGERGDDNLRAIAKWREANLDLRSGDGYSAWRNRQRKAAALRRTLNCNVVRSQVAVALHLGVSERTVADWIAMGCPGKPGHYNLSKISEWREDRDAA